jgi:uncharacterized GH25 family protein
MHNATRPGLALLALALCAPLASGHYHILLPDRHSVKKDESVTLTYRWGHPFEHELFDAPLPERLFVIGPDGKVTELGKQLEKLKHPVPGKKEVAAYRLKFTPDQRGDYTFVLHAPPIFLEEDGEFVQDIVKVVVHVQAQKNWDADSPGAHAKVVPLTRPYGLQPGVVFQARFFHGERKVTGSFSKKEPNPLAGILVEIERFNAKPPQKLPPDEHITRTVKTDPNGVVTCTLPEPGWWAITGQTDGGTLEHKGKQHPRRLRTTLWVHVDEKIGN